MNNIKIKYGELYIWEYTMSKNKDIIIFLKPDYEEEFSPIKYYCITDNGYGSFLMQRYAKECIEFGKIRLLSEEKEIVGNS